MDESEMERQLSLLARHNPILAQLLRSPPDPTYNSSYPLRPFQALPRAPHPRPISNVQSSSAPTLASAEMPPPSPPQPRGARAPENRGALRETPPSHVSALPLPAEVAPVYTALQLHEIRNEDLITDGETAEVNEDLRMGEAAAKISKSLKDVKLADKPQERVEFRQPPTPMFGETALGQVQVANSKKKKKKKPKSADGQPFDADKSSDVTVVDHIMAAEATDSDDCTFCKYQCDWGVSNQAVFYSRDGADGWCADCDPENSEFMIVWRELVDNGRLVAKNPERLEELKSTSFGLKPQASTSRPKVKITSKIDGQDITKFMGVHFCRDSPFGHVDIAKVKMCDDCRQEKFSIMRHRHVSFVPIKGLLPKDFLGKDVSKFVKDPKTDRSPKAQRCMVCTGHATDICEGCPLRLCATCEVVLRTQCKSYLDNIFYYYDRCHIRNDAFLLRSDGGGVPLV